MSKETEAVEAANEVATFNRARLPFAPVFEERYGVDRGKWTVLVEAIFPSARSVNAIGMALAYCKARGLDVMKRPVNIVPMWNSDLRKEVETVWPGLAEVRITAHRTGQYAGIDECVFGPDVEESFRDERGSDKPIGGKTVTYPEWAQYTVYRLVQGVRCAFVGPKVYWKEAYADTKGSGIPNKMWEERARGQLDKVAEVAALRRAFPEELGNTYVAEEMEGRAIRDNSIGFAEPEQAATVAAKPAAAPKPPAAPAAPAIENKPAVAMESVRRQAEVDVVEAEVIEEERHEQAAPAQEDDGRIKKGERKKPEAGPIPNGIVIDDKVIDMKGFLAWARAVLEPATTYDDLEARFEMRIMQYRDAMPDKAWKEGIVGLFNELAMEEGRD
jgi:phage recombination protein Bet